MLGIKVAEALSLHLPEKNIGNADPEEIYEVGILLWVVDSNKTDPNIDLI